MPKRTKNVPFRAGSGGSSRIDPSANEIERSRRPSASWAPAGSGSQSLNRIVETKSRSSDGTWSYPASGTSPSGTQAFSRRTYT
ncbi:MAG TPA: hypothetical protein PKA62_10045 [Thermoanaerobaculia bacterium]|nr:hypothetical protein [Thermoanaerobaculia bacterium]